jgi:16S rRNA A1518/A1519 N6-dimethyltransferase RsmA/KsgA/DIM1 with predicted DNA glycosylase/AP lyase activity
MVEDWSVFDAVVDATFQHRRKAIENGLRLSWSRFAPSQERFESSLDHAPHLRRRPEELTPEEFGELADALVREG